MSRECVAIILSSEPNFDEFAFKYFILNLNKIQKHYEFIFPEFHENSFLENHYEPNYLFTEFNSNIQPNLNYDPDYYISIITPSIGDNYFFVSRDNISFITTDTWDKYFSPPSLFEYLLHCIIAALIQMKPELNVSSHRDTRGCYLDYTFLKTDDKVDITLGYLCDECKNEIITRIGQDYFDDISNVISRSWIGDINIHGTVAYNPTFNHEVQQRRFVKHRKECQS